MNIVLYTDDMEPITVFNLSQDALKFIKEYRTYRIPICDLPDFSSVGHEENVCFPIQFKVVDIWIEKFYRNKKEHFLFFTRNEEFALLLKSDFLPGQRSEIQELEKNSYYQGFLKGLSTIFGDDIYE